jgi:hypothetical protein
LHGLAQAGIRFQQAQQVKVLKKWTELYNAGEAVIRARTAMGRAYREYDQLNIENQIAAKQKQVDFGNLDADEAEAKLRKGQAEKGLADLNKKEPPPAPLLTAEQERILKKNEIETAIDRLKQECRSKLETITDETERVQTQNMYDDRIARHQEELRRYL